MPYYILSGTNSKFKTPSFPPLQNVRQLQITPPSSLHSDRMIPSSHYLLSSLSKQLQRKLGGGRRRRG
ncbi:MAG: hypothetical protein Q9175_008039 [Cornicularia normoerica]